MIRFITKPNDDVVGFTLIFELLAINLVAPMLLTPSDVQIIINDIKYPQTMNVME